jgi:hypothetical protein
METPPTSHAVTTLPSPESGVPLRTVVNRTIGTPLEPPEASAMIEDEKHGGAFRALADRLETLRIRRFAAGGSSADPK